MIDFIRTFILFVRDALAFALMLALGALASWAVMQILFWLKAIALEVQ